MWRSPAKFAGGPVATVVGSGVKEYAKALDVVRGSSAFDVAEAVNRTMERVKERELAGLRRGLPVLATVASSAPFVGLFGTVGGIITAFQKLADPTKGGGNPMHSIMGDLYAQEDLQVPQTDDVRRAISMGRAAMDRALGEGAGRILDRVTVSAGVIQGGVLKYIGHLVDEFS